MSVGNHAAWAAEYTPPTLRAVAQAVVDHYTAITWSHIGIKGNDRHKGGFHRSLRWNRVSRGKGVDYSDRISRDTSQIGTRRKDALRALDISAPPEILIPMCSRIDWAMRHGLIDDVREWYGNDDYGAGQVDGYDNFFNRVVTSDDSHDWHAHLSFFTDTVEAPHTRLIAVLLGAPGWDDLEDDVSAQDVIDGMYEPTPWQSTGVARWAKEEDMGAKVSSRALLEYSLSDNKALLAQQAVIAANLAELRGKDWVNEDAIVDGVLAGLGGRDLDDVAAALKAAFGDDVDDLAAKLTAPAGQG